MKVTQEEEMTLLQDMIERMKLLNELYTVKFNIKKLSCHSEEELLANLDVCGSLDKYIDEVKKGMKNYNNE